MTKWFIEDAPIRTKFNFMVATYLITATVAVACAFMAGNAEDGGLAWAGAAIAILLFIGLFGYTTKKMCCDPYVTTVVRMEALASGDTSSDIQYLHHTNDCVGRMARAMLTFQDNADSVHASSRQQENIVAVLSDALTTLAQNDLTSEIRDPLPEDYEALRSSFNEAIGSLRSAMLSVTSTKQTIDIGTEEIARATEDLAMRTQSQADNVERTLQEMNSLVTEVNKTASDAASMNETMSKAKHEAESSGGIVDQTVEAMSRIERASSEIAGIIEVIDGIAFQTNLLALNAGVEAARAGESGKGFAVVASEVRALAQRAAEAAHDVKEKVTGSQREVETGVTLVGDTGKALQSISTNIVQLTSLVEEISQSTQRQANGLTTVNETLSKIEQMTQQNAAMVEETSAATRTLTQHSNSLSEQISTFQLHQGLGATPNPVSMELAA